MLIIYFKQIKPDVRCMKKKKILSRIVEQSDIPTYLIVISIAVIMYFALII